MTTAIPTAYGGVNFRSRLEARWAAMFDLLGWRWEYEPLDLDGYIPDFLVRGVPGVGASSHRSHNYAMHHVQCGADSTCTRINLRPGGCYDGWSCEVCRHCGARGRDLVCHASPVPCSPDAELLILVEVKPLLTAECAAARDAQVKIERACWFDEPGHAAQVVGSSPTIWWSHWDGDFSEWRNVGKPEMAAGALWREAGNRVQWRSVSPR